MKNIMSVAETCELLDCPQTSFLYYRKNGWVFPPRKSVPKGGITYYADVDLPRLKKIIKRLRKNPGQSKERIFGAKENRTYYH